MLVANISLGKIPALMQQAPKIARPEMVRFVQDATRALVSSSGNVPGLVQVTPPAHGTGDGLVGGRAAQKAGEAKVARDVKRVFASASFVYDTIKAPAAASDFWFNLRGKKKNYAEAERIMKAASSNSKVRNAPIVQRPEASLHQAARRRGTVPRVDVRQVIADPKALDRYIRLVQRRVGMLAAGIVTTYNGRFGALRGVPAFIRRHISSWATGNITEKGGDERSYHVTLRLDAGPLNGDMQRRFNAVLGYREKAMQRQLPFVKRSIQSKIAAQLARV